MVKPVAEADDVRFAYPGGPDVLCGVSGSIRAGEVCAMIGPNAAGKSTLLRAMLGQLSPQRGAIRLAGRHVRSYRRRDRALMIAYVPQRTTVNFAFTVEQIIAMGRFVAGRSGEMTERVLEVCDLLAFRQRPFAALSVGQQQRVLLARALAQAEAGGHLLLLDEPGSAMDLRHVHEMMSRLRSLARDGLAVCVVLHDLNLAATYADRVWLLDEGRTVREGPWTEVLDPRILEPVYGVRIRPVGGAGPARPTNANAEADAHADAEPHAGPEATPRDEASERTQRPVFAVYPQTVH